MSPNVPPRRSRYELARKDGGQTARDMASRLVDEAVKDPEWDSVVWTEYFETVVKERSDWKDLYRASKNVL